MNDAFEAQADWRVWVPDECGLPAQLSTTARSPFVTIFLYWDDVRALADALDRTAVAMDQRDAEGRVAA